MKLKIICFVVLCVCSECEVNKIVPISNLYNLLLFSVFKVIKVHNLKFIVSVTCHLDNRKNGLVRSVFINYEKTKNNNRSSP